MLSIKVFGYQQALIFAITMKLFVVFSSFLLLCIGETEVGQSGSLPRWVCAPISSVSEKQAGKHIFTMHHRWISYMILLLEYIFC